MSRSESLQATEDGVDIRVGREELLRIPAFEKILLTQMGVIAAHVGKFRRGVCTSVFNWGFSRSC
jgi:hypothetical protein